MIDTLPYENSDGYKLLIKHTKDSEFIRKFKSDPNLKDSDKIKFLEYLTQYNKKKHSDFDYYCQIFFRKNKFQNGIYKGNKNHKFVRIKDVESVKTWIKRIVNKNIDYLLNLIMDENVPDDLRYKAFQKLLETTIRDEIVNDSDQAIRFLGVPALSVSVEPFLNEAKYDEWNAWSVPIPDSEKDILSKSKIRDLDCRLGLSENIDLDKFVVVYTIKNCKKVAKPTVFDAGFYPQFEPGGKTKPLDKCKHLSGFEEYVHDPTKFKNILETPYSIKK